ncbi:MAG: LysE family translocator [Deltaproteobacteria bacterium]|nr:LysE family translocator [Deltaproteobacteria bacterium]MBW2351397.1 LysE family translocator [Deltaproteobacteria bacterium]
MDFVNSQLITFVAVTLVLTVTPGVDTFIIMRNVLRGGPKDGFYTAIGICSGLFVHASLSAFGISVILVRSAVFFNFVKMAGAIYLVWLGLSSIYGAMRHKNSFEYTQSAVPKEKLYPTKSLREGLLSNVLNPKPAVFYLAFFPQFINHGDPVFVKTMFLASIQFVIGISWLIMLSFFVSQVKNYIEKPSIKKALDTLSGSILIAFGIKIGLQNN